MIKHIVAFQFHDRAQAPIVAEKLNALLGVVPTLRSMETGVDFMGSPRSYDLVLISTFDDKAGLEAYDAHEAHQAVRAYINTVRKASVAVDYEF